MQSGTELVFDSVLMFEAEKLRLAEQLRLSAEKNLQYQSLGIGFIGGLSTVVAASVAMGVIESAVTAGANRKGLEQLNSYHQAMIAIRYGGRFRKLNDIEHCQLAAPELWMSKETDAEGDAAVYYTMLIGDPFVVIHLLDGTPLSVQWSSVEQYWVVLPGQAWLKR